MLKISRVRTIDPQELAPRLVFQEEDEPVKQAYLAQLVEILSRGSEDLLVLEARRDDVLVGFLIAQSLPRFVFVSQTWSLPGNSWQVADELFSRLFLWAIGLGKTAIRAETTRDVQAFHRRFGFVEKSITIEREITNEMVNKVVKRSQEVLNG